MALYSYSTQRRRIRARVREHLEHARQSVSNDLHTDVFNDHAVFDPRRASTSVNQTNCVAIASTMEGVRSITDNSSQPVSMRPQPAARPRELRRQFAPHLLARPQRSSEDHNLTVSGDNNMINTLLTSIIKTMEEQKELLKQISQQLSQNTILLQNLATEGMTPAAVPDGMLPLKSHEEVSQLEEKLADKEYRTKMIQHLSCIGGDSVTSLVRRVLNRIFSPELALTYNFSGAKGKNSFHRLQMRGVLIAAVRRTFNSSSEADIDGITRKWFSNARDRDGGRIRRTFDGTCSNCPGTHQLQTL